MWEWKRIQWIEQEVKIWLYRQYVSLQESVLENEIHKILGDFEIRMDLQISSPIRQHQVSINKTNRNCHQDDYRGSQNENERKWKDKQITKSYQRAEKNVEHKGEGSVPFEYPSKA